MYSTSIFRPTVDLVGLTQLHQHSLIGSKLQEKPFGQISTFHLNHSFLVKNQTMVVMVVKHIMLSPGWLIMKLLIEHAPFIKLEVKTMDNNAPQWNFAEIVVQVKLAPYRMNISFMVLMSLGM